MVSYQRLGIVLSLLALTAVGISGCSTNGSQQPVGGPTRPTNQTATNSTNPTQTNSKQSPASTENTADRVEPSSSSPTSITVENPSLTQIETWINEGQIYGVQNPQTNEPGRVVLMKERQTHPVTPTTVRHWPSTRFEVVAVLNDPQNQFGSTAWGNGLSREIHWLHLAANVNVVINARNETNPQPSTSSSNVQQSQWNPTVVQAMQYVSKYTRIPLQAPSDVQAASYDGRFYLSAQAQATKSSYNVALQYTTTKLAVNSPKINKYPNGALAAWVGGFGAKEYPTAADARRTVSQTGFHVSSNAEKVSLGHGIIGQVSNQHQMGIVNWHEGDWSLQVNNGTMNADITLAKQIVAYLNQYLLPETYGSLQVVNAGDGEHTSLQWAYGRVVYNCSNYHLALAAIKTAMSMKPFSADQ